MSQGSRGITQISGNTSAFMSIGAKPNFKKEATKEEIELASEIISTELTLEELRNAYEIQESKEVPVNKKNNIEWIKSKLNT